MVWEQDPLDVVSVGPRPQEEPPPHLQPALQERPDHLDRVHRQVRVRDVDLDDDLQDVEDDHPREVVLRPLERESPSPVDPVVD